MFAPVKNLSNGIKYEVEVDDDAKFVETVAMVDKYVFEHLDESPFPIYDGYIHSYLQLFWDPRIHEIYDDVAVFAYGPNREFIPLRENLDSEIFPGSDLKLQPDAGC